MRRPSTLYLILSLMILTGQSAVAQQLAGFTESRAAEQAALEDILQALPAPETFRRHLFEITREPHVAGTPGNQRVIDYLGRAMREAGLEVRNYDYDVYLPGAGSVTVQLVSPDTLTLNNREDVLEEDPYTAHPDLTHGWTAYSGSGDVTGQVVYANFGTREDFEKLAELGVSVEGKIVIARYGGNFRGYKAKYAEEAGAIGLIMYSDPEQGGFAAGDPYPEGRFINESTIQRGSLLTLDYFGDPLTPMRPALPLDGDVQVERLDPAEVPFHTIPVAPLPYGSAVEILKRMAEGAVPEGWAGALPIDYKLLGGSDLTVRVAVDQPADLKRITNVVGVVEGSEFPDEWIILGSHHDAWSFGANDPNGGTAMLLTLADALGEMLAQGIRPRRSIMIAHWDAEEFGIIGSVEWVEQFEAELMANGIAYINADMSVTGPNFGGASSPSLKKPIIDAAKSVEYPGESRSVYEHWVAQQPGDHVPQLGNLGGGSDHVGFYMFAGVPSAGISMGGWAPIYHSNYDTFAWYERFADTSFVYGPTLARINGVLATRLANADVIPYDVQRYATDLKSHLEALDERAAERGLGVSVSPLDDAVERLAEAAGRYHVGVAQLLQSGAPANGVIERINRELIGLEKAFHHEPGLPFGAWFRNLYSAADPYSGYAAWMLPGLRLAIEEGDEDAFRAWKSVYRSAIGDLTERIDHVTAMLAAP